RPGLRLGPLACERAAIVETWAAALVAVLGRSLLAKGRMPPRLQEPREQEPPFSAPSHLSIEFLDRFPPPPSLQTPSRGFSLRTKVLSCVGSASHSRAMVVTGWSGASAGKPVRRTRYFSCWKLIFSPEAKKRADFTCACKPATTT